MKKPKQSSLKKQLAEAIARQKDYENGYNAARAERNSLSTQVTAKGLEIEDLKKQLTWTKQMCQQLVQTVSDLGRSK